MKKKSIDEDKIDSGKNNISNLSNNVAAAKINTASASKDGTTEDKVFNVNDIAHGQIAGVETRQSFVSTDSVNIFNAEQATDIMNNSITLSTPTKEKTLKATDIVKNPVTEDITALELTENDIFLTIDYTDKINLAMQQRNYKIIHSIIVKNKSEHIIKNITVRLTASPGFFNEYSFDIIEIAPKAEYVLKDIPILLEFDFFADITERVQADIIAEIIKENKIIKRQNKPIILLSFEEWQGTSYSPETLASYVLPESIAVTGIVNKAEAIIKSRGLSFDGYQSGDPDAVMAQLDAIYNVIRDMNINYAMMPANFDMVQKVRFPDIIVDKGMGTCLDLTLLFAACAERIGINPFLMMYEGHTFPGFWLKDITFRECVTDDITSIRKRLSPGVSELAVAESTYVTNPKTFLSTAMEQSASYTLSDKKFLFVLDIKRARYAGIVPLCVTYDDNGTCKIDKEVIYAPPQKHNTKNFVSATDEPEGADKTSRYFRWQRNLLDISLRNPLINYKIKKAGIPILAPNLENIEDMLACEETFALLPRPVEFNEVLDLTVFNASEYADTSALLKAGLQEKRLFTMLTESELQKKAIELFRSTRTIIEETGASTLYLALGFLKWKDEKKHEDRYSPLVLLPIELKRKSIKSGFNIKMRDDEFQVNLSLIEMLKNIFALDASALMNISEGETGISLKELFTVARRLIMHMPGWDIIEAASIGSFHFSKFVMWNDLKVREENIKKNPVVASLIQGRPSESLTQQHTQAEASIVSELFMPLPADSSQSLSVCDAVKGKTFVLHGPPGTGKSQTITNIIVNFLAAGKRVLFVAEKIAALEVVKKRLVKLGLFDFCLELHSNKSNKKNVLSQFEPLFTAHERAEIVKYSDSVENLAEVSYDLDAFRNEMHRKYPTGCTVYEAINHYYRYETESEIPEFAVLSVDEKEYLKTVEEINELKRAGIILGEAHNSAFFGIERADYTFSLRDEVSAACDKIAGAYQGFIEALLETGGYCNNGYTGNYFEIKNIYDTLSGIGARYKMNGFVRFFTALSKHNRTLKKSANFKLFKKLFKENSNRFYALFATFEKFFTAERDLENCLKYGEYFENYLDWPFEIFHAAARYKSNLSTLKDYCGYNAVRDKLKGKPWSDAVTTAYHTGEVDSSRLINYFNKSFWHNWLHEAIKSSNILNSFSAAGFSEKLNRFAALTTLSEELSKKEVYKRIVERIPRMTSMTAATSEPAILQKAMRTQGRGLSLRKLFDKIPNLIAKTKPCMLMSPLSVAQYLPADFEKFDAVIFDEASQLLTNEAVGALSRADSAVIVGDPKQLPPTTFFNSMHGEDDDDFETQDLESVLDDMLTLNLPEYYLLWHYRSAHESLITYSNVNFYDEKLVTFPSVDDRKSKVSLRLIKGVYDRGSTRTNPMEAQAVVDYLFQLLKDKIDKSVGIITFNSTQQNLIENLIDERLKTEPELEEYFTREYEPVFVKNIENVQGDERDIILFSICYGYDKDNRMTVNFGPVNQQGGWRRLNVAVTRARADMMVFSTINSDAIRLSANCAPGVQCLKEFLRYAESSSYYIPSKGGKSDSALIERIEYRLKEAGYSTVTALGKSTNKLDIAVIDKNDETKYCMGIVLDSKYYSDIVNTRDREFGKEEFLRGMGWNIVRVHSSEWWQDEEREAKRLINILEGKVSVDAGNTGALQSFIDEYNTGTPLILENIPKSTYSFTNLKKRSQALFYEYQSADIIRGQIAEIIACESPVSKEVISQRILNAWEFSRSSQKFDQYLDMLIKSRKAYYNTTERTQFFWKDNTCVMLENFRDNTEAKRAYTEISKEEYAACAYYILKHSLSIGEDDLIRETARQFGFMKTPAVTARISYAVSKIITDRLAERTVSGTIKLI